jgi:hypothetical protein
MHAIYPQSFYMMYTYLYDTARNCCFIDGVHQQGYIYQQKFSLVNIKLKWVKDRTRDSVVTGQRDRKAARILVSIIYSSFECCLPIYYLSASYVHFPHLDYKFQLCKIDFFTFGF